MTIDVKQRTEKKSPYSDKFFGRRSAILVKLCINRFSENLFLQIWPKVSKLAKINPCKGLSGNKIKKLIRS